MRRSTKDEKKEEVQGPTPAQKDGDGAPLEPSFEGAASDRSFSRREAVGLTGAALAGFATLAVAKANPAIAAVTGSEVTSPQRTAAKPEKNVVEASPLGAEEAGTRSVFVPGLGNVSSRAYIIGSSAFNNITRDLPVALAVDVPAVVQTQPRQLANQEFNFPDQFAVQVITTSRTNIRVRIRRIDANGGWGQQLRLDLWVVESFRF